MLKGWQAEARADGGSWPAAMSAGLLATFGPLFYDYQLLLRPRPSRQPDTLPQQGPKESPQSAGIENADLALLHTTLATWSLITNPTSGIDITHHSLPETTAAADRRAGIRPGPVTFLSST